MADAERVDEAVEADLAALVDGVEQIAHRGLAVAFDLLELDLLVALAQQEDVARLLDPALLEEPFDLLFAQALDVEGAARHEQHQMLDLLIRAGELAGAAGARALLAGGGFLAYDIGVQVAGALLRKMIGLRVLRPLVDDDVDDLRDDVAGALDDHGVADADVAAVAQHLALAADALDVILVVQRDVLHHHAADADRFQLADRRERAGAADLDLDVLQDGDGALGREFVRDAPARRARHEAEPFLPVDAVDLVDDAVDVVIESGAALLDVAVESDQLLDRTAQSGQRIGLEATGLEPLDHAALRVGRHLAHLAPGIGEKTERPRGGDHRVLLAQGAGGRVARIGENGCARLLLPLVELQEVGLGHVDLAAHLGDLRHVPALELLRHVMQRADVGGDVFAFGAVAARRGGDQSAVLVAQRHRQAVDLRLSAEVDLVVVGQFEEAADAADEVDHVLLGEGVVERQHRHRVADFGEAARGRGADFERQRLQCAQFRKARLDCRVARAKRVVFGVADGRPVVLVVALVVLRDFLAEARMLRRRLLLGQEFDRGSVGFDFGRHSVLSQSADAPSALSVIARESGQSSNHITSGDYWMPRLRGA